MMGSPGGAFRAVWADRELGAGAREEGGQHVRHAHRADGDARGGEPEGMRIGEQLHAAEHGLEVVEGLTHPHEDDVGHRPLRRASPVPGTIGGGEGTRRVDARVHGPIGIAADPLHQAVLIDDLAGREVAREAVVPRLAEAAGACAADLARQAEGGAEGVSPFFGGDDHRLDEAAVLRLQQEPHRSVARRRAVVHREADPWRQCDERGAGPGADPRLRQGAVAPPRAAARVVREGVAKGSLGGALATRHTATSGRVEVTRQRVGVVIGEGRRRGVEGRGHGSRRGSTGPSLLALSSKEDMKTLLMSKDELADRRFEKPSGFNSLWRSCGKPSGRKWIKKTPIGSAFCLQTGARFGTLLLGSSAAHRATELTQSQKPTGVLQPRIGTSSDVSNRG